MNTRNDTLDELNKQIATVTFQQIKEKQRKKMSRRLVTNLALGDGISF